MTNSSDTRDAAPYTLLAEGYDAVMAHVDYDEWADYVHELLETYAPEARNLLELGCGTGSFALRLQPLGAYHYRAADGAEAMVAVARRKAEEANIPVDFDTFDFRAVPSDLSADAVLLLYDGLNYLLNPEDLTRLFAGVRGVLRPGGVFVFDQSTPANSLNNADGFDDAGRTPAFRYLRTSRYDEGTRLHTTLFRLGIDGKTYTETHVQRAYTRTEVAEAIAAAGFDVLAPYDGFTDDPATDASERIHWVLRQSLSRPAAP